MLNRIYLFLMLILLLGVHQSTAQNFVEKVTNFFEFELKTNNLDTTHYIPKVVAAPIITYEPATNLALGVGAKLLFKPKKAGLETRTSNIPISISYTLNNQFIFWSEYNIFFPQERWLLKGNLIYSKYPVSYFGLGSNTLQSDALEISFDQVLVEPLLLKKVKNNWFAGGGIRYNQTFNPGIEDSEEGIAHPRLVDSLSATSLGLELAVTLDSRDNILNALSGNFLEFTHGVYDEALGSTHQFMLSRVDYRKYFRLSPNRLDVIALQLYARLTWGDTPLLEQSALGGAELLRGFQEGRFRDKFAYFAQAEYRWQTFEQIGFVFYGGAGNIVNEGQGLELGNLKYSLGTGVRLKIIKSENLNIRLDYAFGFGDEIENNFYLGLAEAF